MLFHHSLSITVITILFSRIVFYFMNLQFYLPTFRLGGLLRFFYIWDKGLSFWGAILGLTIMMIIICFKKNESILKWIDALVIPVGLGIIIANFGQLLDGQGYGTPTNLPWGMTYESINVKYTVPIHPTQIYSMLYVGGILFFIKKHRQYEFFKKEGNISLFAITFYSFVRFWMEFLRGDDTIDILGIRLAAIISAIIFLISGYILFKRYKKSHIPN